MHSLRLQPSSWVPATLRRWRFVLASLTPAERRALLRVALTRDARDWRTMLRHARTVVFVCHGNIIRSPFGAAALQREVAARPRQVSIESAGLSATPGTGADPRAIASAAERGLDLSGHTSRQLEAILVGRADLVFVMDYLNLGRALARFPEAKGKFVLLAGCAPDGQVHFREIRDPVAGGSADVAASHDEVLASVRRVATAWDEQPG